MTGTHMIRIHATRANSATALRTRTTRTPFAATLALITLALGAAFLPACQKANSTTYGITATFGPTNFQATTYSNTYSEGSSTFTINADMTTTADTSSLLMRFHAPSQLNAPFNSDTSLTTTLIYTIGQGSDNYIAGLGDASGHCIITITAWDSTQHTIAGTFTGETINNSSSADSLSITNGKFNTTYTTTN